MTLDHKELLRILSYSKRTGVFQWRVARRGWRGISPGDVAGTPHNSGYLSIRINGVAHLAHRLAWFYVTGKWPPEQVDHKNCVKRDNRWRNLRCVSHQENSQNRTGRGYFKLGPRRYRADIGCNYRTVFCGYFTTAKAARAAYLSAKRDLHQGWVRP